MRIFEGDKPAAQFEAIQQKGGNFYCFSCATHAEISSSYLNTHSLATETIHDRVNQVMKTELSLSKSTQQKLKLYDSLDKEYTRNSEHVPLNFLNQRKVYQIN